MRNILAVFFVVCVFSTHTLKAQLQFDAKSFGAKGDGIEMDTASIQTAIDKAFDKGGGVITIPPGTYKVGTLVLKDNIDLHLQPGAELLGSPSTSDYIEIHQRFESRTSELYARYFVVFAEGARNISITGSGVINGNGLKNFLRPDPQNMRPFLVRLVNCQNVTIRDVHLVEAANWTLHLLGCRDVNVDGIVIENGSDANRDGLDIDSCQRVSVSNSRFSTGDDAIVMKSTSDVPCEDIAITNCIIRTRASAIKTGTESNGGFRNITVSNCIIRDLPHHTGIELMTVDGGLMQNIVFNNIAMVNVATPFFIRLGIRARPYKSGQYVSKVDDVKDITLSNVSVINAKYPSSIMGLHNKKVSNIMIDNYTVRYTDTQDAAAYNEVPFEEFSYPMARMFTRLPAYGLYCRNVDGLRLYNITMYSAENEKRPAMAFDRVNGLSLWSIRGSVKNENAPLAHFRNTRDVSASACGSIGATKVLFEEEKSSVNISLSNNVLHPGQREDAVVEAIEDQKSFEDFDTDTKYSVIQGVLTHGMMAHDLGLKPLTVDLDITKRGVLQLCLLMLNESPRPEKVLLKYDGKVQEFMVSWSEWGWAPITLLKEYDKNTTVRYEIMAGDKNTHLKIAKVYLRHQNIRNTD